MTLHFAYEGPLDTGKPKSGGIIARTDNQGPGKALADLFVQGLDRFKIDGFVDVVMKMDEESVHQCFFDGVHDPTSLKNNPFSHAVIASQKSLIRGNKAI